MRFLIAADIGEDIRKTPSNCTAPYRHPDYIAVSVGTGSKVPYNMRQCSHAKPNEGSNIAKTFTASRSRP